MDNWGKTLALMLVVLFLMSFEVTFATTQTESEWHVQTVDTNGTSLARGCHIAIDSNNKPHIVYTGYDPPHQEDNVRYASWNGSDWNIQTIPYATTFSFALDANNSPHILYWAGGKLLYASMVGSNWSIQTVDETFGLGFGSLVLDSTGTPHIAYTDGKAVKYASWTGTNWATKTVVTSSEILLRLSLALDKNNTPYIMYAQPTSYKDIITGSNRNSIAIKFAIYENSVWNIQSPLASSNLNYYGNMVLDSKGYPHFIVAQNHFLNDSFTFVSNLIFVSWNGSAWNMQTVASNINLSSASENYLGSLALDSHDYPNIVYLTSAPKPLMYAFWTGNFWDIQTIDTNISATEPGNLAIDANGNPHISYIGLPLGTSYDPYHPLAYIMYATATATTPASSPSQTSPIISVLLVLTLILAVIVVSLLLFRRHRKTPKA